MDMLKTLLRLGATVAPPLTDINDSPVTLKHVQNAVRAFVDKQTYSLIVVFFSGHGILSLTAP